MNRKAKTLQAIFDFHTARAPPRRRKRKSKKPERILFKDKKMLDADRCERNRQLLRKQSCIFDAMGALFRLKSEVEITDPEIKQHLQFMIADLILLESLNWPEETKNGN